MIRLGTLVTSATFRHPGPLAISVAEVDAMSGGRVEFGIGAGWFEAEHRAYGIPFPGLGERFERLEEQLDLITGLWSTPVGERFDYRGTHYTVTDSPALPKPLQRPGPPIVIGGGGRSAPRTRGAVRRGVQSRVPRLDFVPVQYDRVRAALQRAGRASGTSSTRGVRGVRGPRRV